QRVHHGQAGRNLINLVAIAVCVIHWVTFRVLVLVQRGGIIIVALERIHGGEPAGRRIEVPRAVVVEGEGGVELFAGEEIIVRGGTCLIGEIAEGVVVVAVGDCASGV